MVTAQIYISCCIGTYKTVTPLKMGIQAAAAAAAAESNMCNWLTSTQVLRTTAAELN